MPLPGITPRTQSDLVEQEKKPVVDIVKLPGIETLHTRPADDIAAVLSNFIRSRPKMVSMKFVVGSHIEVVTQE